MSLLEDGNGSRDRLTDTRRFYDLLDRLEGRIGGRRMLATCNGRMNWPERGIY